MMRASWAAAARATCGRRPGATAALCRGTRWRRRCGPARSRRPCWRRRQPRRPLRRTPVTRLRTTQRRAEPRAPTCSARRLRGVSWGSPLRRSRVRQPRDACAPGAQVAFKREVAETFLRCVSMGFDQARPRPRGPGPGRLLAGYSAGRDGVKGRSPPLVRMNAHGAELRMAVARGALHPAARKRRARRAQHGAAQPRRARRWWAGRVAARLTRRCAPAGPGRHRAQRAQDCGGPLVRGLRAVHPDDRAGAVRPRAAAHAAGVCAALLRGRARDRHAGARAPPVCMRARGVRSLLVTQCVPGSPQQCHYCSCACYALCGCLARVVLLLLPVCAPRQCGTPRIGKHAIRRH